MSSLLFPKNHIFHIRLLETVQKHNRTFTVVLTTRGSARQAHVKATLSVNRVLAAWTGNFNVYLTSEKEQT